MDLVEEKDSTLSKFRKRNKILILILFSLIISLALITGALILHLLHTIPKSEPDSVVNPAVNAFCSVTNDTSSCLTSLNHIISRKSMFHPDQIFNLYLKTAVEHLENVTIFLTRDNRNTLRNCSSLLQDALSQLERASKSMHATPEIDSQSREVRSEIVNGIIAAEYDLSAYVEDESTDVSEAMKEKVYVVKDYVGACADYLMRLDEADAKFREANAVNYTNSWLKLENMLHVCLFGSQYMLLMLLFCSLYRISRC